MHLMKGCSKEGGSSVMSVLSTYALCCCKHAKLRCG